MTKLASSLKELKKKILEESTDNIIVVRKPYCFVEIHWLGNNGVTYWGCGFSKWSTQDMNFINKVRKLQLRWRKFLGLPCDDIDNSFLIQKYGWNEERGIAIAKGRAIADTIKQILDANNQPANGIKKQSLEEAMSKVVIQKR